MKIKLCILAVCFVLATAFAQYTLELNTWPEDHLDYVCPEQTYNINYSHNGNAFTLLDDGPSTLPLHYNEFEYGDGVNCDRFFVGNRYGHHPLLRCINDDCGNIQVTPYYGEFKLKNNQTGIESNITFIYVFPDLIAHYNFDWFNVGDYLFKDMPLRIYRCENGICNGNEVADIGAYEYYKPHRDGDYSHVNDAFPDWHGQYWKRFEQFTIKKFSGGIDYTNYQFCWEIDKRIIQGKRTCNIFGCNVEIEIDQLSEPHNNCVYGTLSCNAPGASCPLGQTCNESNGQCETPAGEGQPPACVGYYTPEFANPTSPPVPILSGTVPVQVKVLWSPNCTAPPLDFLFNGGLVHHFPTATSSSNPNWYYDFSWDTIDYPNTPPYDYDFIQATVIGNAPNGNSDGENVILNNLQCPGPCSAYQDCSVVNNNFVCTNKTCPDGCIPDQSTFQCGTPLTLPAHGSDGTSICYPEICPLPTPPIGSKCNNTPEVCTDTENASGNYECKSLDEITCNTSVSNLQNIPNLKGLQCANGHLCDLGKNPPCQPVLNWPPKYAFNIGVLPDSGTVYNFWFQSKLSVETSRPTFSSIGLYCLDCPNQPDSASFNHALTGQTVENGLYQLEIENNDLFGPFNYAKIQLTDTIDASKSSGFASGNEKTETMILKLNAGYSGACVTEDKTVKGKTGAAVKPRVQYDWSWTTIGLDECNANNPNGFYCDATQFAIALFQRLHEIEQNPSQVSVLQNFDASLLKDGFSDDFLLDFNHFALTTDFSNTPSWFVSDWSKYASPNRLVFQNDTNPSDPKQITSPAQYEAEISSTNWSFFDASGQPNATITVKFKTKLADPNPNHPLYYLPIDSRIGENPHEGETIANRNGYGTTFMGDPIALAPNTQTFELSNGEFAVTELDSFTQTNALNRRGRLFSLDLMNKTIVFSPVNATPIAMKVIPQNNTAQAHYGIASGGTDITLSNSDSIASWTGVASTGFSSHCLGFNNRPLYLLRPDLNATAGSCTTDSDDRGFLWSNAASDQAVFLESVVYTPVGQNFEFITACGGPSEWVSPNDILDNHQINQALNLNFSEQTVDVSTLADMLELLQSEWACQFVSADNQKMELFWDRNALTSELAPENGNAHDYTQIGLDSGLLCNN